MYIYIYIGKGHDHQHIIINIIDQLSTLSKKLMVDKSLSFGFKMTPIIFQTLGNIHNILLR